ncbi:MAG: hypothetical protein JSS43_33635 [Proteobacteria bacterium]|nr:hypothetical protein [Pseudomonadota bacterium]
MTPHEQPAAAEAPMLTIVLNLLAPLLAACGLTDLAFARRAAAEALASHGAEGTVQWLAAAQIVGYAAAGLDTLRVSAAAPPDGMKAMRDTASRLAAAAARAGRALTEHCHAGGPVYGSGSGPAADSHAGPPEEAVLAALHSVSAQVRAAQARFHDAADRCAPPAGLASKSRTDAPAEANQPLPTGGPRHVTDRVVARPPDPPPQADGPAAPSGGAMAGPAGTALSANGAAGLPAPSPAAAGRAATVKPTAFRPGRLRKPGTHPANAREVSAEPCLVPLPAGSDADRTRRLAWAGAMTQVAGDCAVRLPELAPPQRRLERLRIQALSSVAQCLVQSDGRYTASISM